MTRSAVASGARKECPSVPIEAAVERSLARARLARHGGAYTKILEAEARRFARSLAAAEKPLALSGFTVAVKDLVSVAGQPLGAGSAARADAAAEDSDAAIVATLRARGAIIVGLSALHEFGFGVTGVNAYAGTPANPRAPGRIPGGSSSGSAVAVAEGSARVAVGTDTGGSVRIPAALCGVVGFKPAGDAYPTDGVLPLAPSLDTVGLLAADVEDAAAVHWALGERIDRRDRPDRIGVARAELEVADPAVAKPVGAALARLGRHGCTLIDVEWPAGDDVVEASTTIMFAEAARVHRAGLASTPGGYGEDVRRRLQAGAEITYADYNAADRERRRLANRARAQLLEVECVVGPTVGVPAPTLEEASDAAAPGRLVACTRLANLARLPAISVPLPGTDPPVGLQVTAPTDHAALAAAMWIERTLERGQS